MFSIHNMVKTLQSDNKKHLYYGKVTSCIRNTIHQLNQQVLFSKDIRSVKPKLS